MRFLQDNIKFIPADTVQHIPVRGKDFFQYICQSDKNAVALQMAFLDYLQIIHIQHDTTNSIALLPGEASLNPFHVGRPVLQEQWNRLHR